MKGEQYVPPSAITFGHWVVNNPSIVMATNTNTDEEAQSSLSPQWGRGISNLNANIHCVLTMYFYSFDLRWYRLVGHFSRRGFLLTSFHLGNRPKLGRKERGGAQKGEISEPQYVKWSRFGYVSESPHNL